MGVFKFIDKKIDIVSEKLEDRLTKSGLIFDSANDVDSDEYDYDGDEISVKLSFNYDKKGKLTFETTDEFQFLFYNKNAKQDVYMIFIGAFFEWDGASVPEHLRGIVDVQKLLFPSLIHDYLYSKYGEIVRYDCKNRTFLGKVEYNRHDADIIFRYLVETLTKDRSLAIAVHHAVQTFGQDHFKKA